MTTTDRGLVTDSPQVHGVPIARVSDELGVPMPTLRSWEIRYGIPATDRTGGRHRRYTPADLHALRLMRDQIARGHRASVAAAAVHALLGASGVAADLVRQILTAAAQLDEGAITRAIELGAATLGAGASIDQVVLPALRQVGDWNRRQACDTRQEQLVVATVRVWFHRSSTQPVAPTINSAPVVLGCGPGDLHTIGLEALAMLLRRQGWPCKILGGGTPTARLNSFAAAGTAAAVVITSQLVSGRRQAAASVQIAHHHRIPVFYAGNAFNRPATRRQLPGIYLGTNIEHAAATITAALTSRGTTAEPPAIKDLVTGS